MLVIDIATEEFDSGNIYDAERALGGLQAASTVQDVGSVVKELQASARSFTARSLLVQLRARDGEGTGSTGLVVKSSPATVSDTGRSSGADSTGMINKSLHGTVSADTVLCSAGLVVKSLPATASTDAVMWSGGSFQGQRRC